MTRKWKEQCVKIPSKMRVNLFAFTCHVIVGCWHDPENWHGWSPSECRGYTGGQALVPRLNIWIMGPALVRMLKRLQDIDRIWSRYLGYLLCEEYEGSSHTSYQRRRSLGLLVWCEVCHQCQLRKRSNVLYGKARRGTSFLHNVTCRPCRTPGNISCSLLQFMRCGGRPFLFCTP